MAWDEDVFGPLKGQSASAGWDEDVFGPKPKPQAAAKAAPVVPPAPVEDPGFFKSALIGAGRTFDKLGAGAQQMYYGATGNDAKLAAIRDEQQSNDQAYAPLAKQRPWATGIGESLPAMAIPLGGPLASTGGMVARAGLGNAAIGGMKYGDAGERAGNALKEGVGGAAGAFAGRAIGAAIPRALNLQPVVGQPTAMQMTHAATLDAAGVPLSIGERTGSKLVRSMEDAFGVIPATAGRAQAIKQAQTDAFNVAAAKFAGVNPQLMQGPNLTPAVTAANRTATGQEIGNIAARNTLQADSPLMSGILSVRNEVSQYSDETAKPVLSKINEVLRKVETDAAGNVTMPGHVYRELQSRIGTQMRKTTNGDIAHHLGMLRDTLRDGMERSIPQAEMAAWKEANKRYASSITLQDVAARSPDGNISPAALFQAMKGKQGDLADLGAAGKSLIQPLPSSGTAERSFTVRFMNNPLSATVTGLGGYPASVLQSMLHAQSKRPQGLLNISPEVMRLPGIGGGLGGGLLGSYLLNDAFSNRREQY